MPSDVLAPFLITMSVVTGAAIVLILRGPVGRALGRRIEGIAPPAPELAARVQELESRLADLEHDRSRVLELEERLDFTERLLSAGQERAPREAPR